VSKLEQTVATADTALGQRIDNISVSVDGMTGGVKNSAIAIIQGNLAQVAARKTLSASVAGNSAQLDRIDEVIVNEKEATARSLLSLQTDVNGNKASINSLNAHTERCCHPRYRRGGCQLRIQHQYNSGGEVGLYACHAGANYRGYIGWRSAAAIHGHIQEHGKT